MMVDDYSRRLVFIAVVVLGAQLLHGVQATRTSAPDDDELSRPANENHISSQIHDFLVPVSPSMSAELRAMEKEMLKEGSMRDHSKDQIAQNIPLELDLKEMKDIDEFKKLADSFKPKLFSDDYSTITCRTEVNAEFTLVKYVCPWFQYCCRKNTKCCLSPEIPYSAMAEAEFVAGLITFFVILTMLITGCCWCYVKISITRIPTESDTVTTDDSAKLVV